MKSLTLALVMVTGTGGLLVTVADEAAATKCSTGRTVCADAIAQAKAVCQEAHSVITCRAEVVCGGFGQSPTGLAGDLSWRCSAVASGFCDARDRLRGGASWSGGTDTGDKDTDTSTVCKKRHTFGWPGICRSEKVSVLTKASGTSEDPVLGVDVESTPTDRARSSDKGRACT